jgi:hypothetical protein
MISMRKKSLHLIFGGNRISGGAAVRRCDSCKLLKGRGFSCGIGIEMSRPFGGHVLE